MHFYPRSPCGERLCRRLLNSANSVFLSTLSLRRATLVLLTLRSTTEHFYPRSPCGERLERVEFKLNLINEISIHALLAESDFAFLRMAGGSLAFLSTLSLRRATFRLRPYYLTNYHFYPRSPCGERRAVYNKYILLHLFLSTLSLRRATH